MQSYERRPSGHAVNLTDQCRSGDVAPLTLSQPTQPDREWTPRDHATSSTNWNRLTGNINSPPPSQSTLQSDERGNHALNPTNWEDYANDIDPPPPSQLTLLRYNRRPGGHTISLKGRDWTDDTNPQSQPMPPSRKRKPGDRAASPTRSDQHADDPPSPSQHTRLLKKGRLSYQPNDMTADPDEDDEDQVSGDEDEKRKRWTDSELKQFVYALMGLDGCWEKFLKNSNDALKKVSTVTGGEVLSPSNFIQDCRQALSQAF